MPSSPVRRRAAVCAAALMMTGALAAAPAEAHHAGPQPGPINAKTTYGWRLADWRWEWHEDLSWNFRPWQRASTGSGIAYIRWGMLVLDSSVEQFYYPSRGSVRAIWPQRGQRYGRWEMRLRAPVWYDDSRDYRVRAELVPVDRAMRRCGAHNIAFAAFNAGGSRVNVYARNAGKQWTYTHRPLTPLGRWNWHTYAIEVTRRRISWFIDAHVVATLRNTQALPDVRLTPRLSLLGVRGAWMDRARVGVDWIRHFPLRNPNLESVRAPAPTVSNLRRC